MLCENKMHFDCLNDIAYKHTENKQAEFVINPYPANVENMASS